VNKNIQVSATKINNNCRAKYSFAPISISKYRDKPSTFQNAELSAFPHFCSKFRRKIIIEIENLLN